MTSRAWLSRQNVDDLLLLLVEPGELGGKAVHLDHQHGGGIGRKAEVEGLFDRRQDALVHQFHGRRDDARGDDLRRRVLAASSTLLKTARRVR